ncbi:MAG: DivIVA domain-containing protein [Candidatus Methylomirabilia bacterium]
MRITPTDVRQQEFRRQMFRGYDTQEVVNFLEDVADDYEQLVRENAVLKEQVAALSERVREVEDLKVALQETLITTRQLTEEMKDSARREAEEAKASARQDVEEMKDSARREAHLLIRDAELQGEKLLEAARAEEARIQNEVLSLKRIRQQLAQGLRSTIEMHQRLIAQVLPDEGPGPS